MANKMGIHPHIDGRFLAQRTVASAIDPYLNDGLEIAARCSAEGEYSELGGVPPQLPNHLAVGVVT